MYQKVNFEIWQPIAPQLCNITKNCPQCGIYMYVHLSLNSNMEELLAHYWDIFDFLKGSFLKWEIAMWTTIGQIAGLQRRFITNNLTQWGSDIMRSILTSHAMVTDKPQNVHKTCFEQFQLPPCVTSKLTLSCLMVIVSSLFFVNLIFNQLFDIWHILDTFLTFWHMTYYLNQHSPSQGFFDWK